MGEAVRVAPGPAVADVYNPVPVSHARMLLVAGHLDAVAAWTQGRGLDVDDLATYVGEQEHIVLARLLLAQERPDRALVLVRRLVEHAREQGRCGDLVELLALEALARIGVGSDRDATAVLAEAVELASRQRRIRVFVDHGTPMARALERLLDAQKAGDPSAAAAPSEHLVRVLEAFPAAGRPDPGHAQARLVDPLTARELEVLELLAPGRSNRAIADELVVGLDTVKKHVSHILDKLAAGNRTEAVARARELGLLR
jgi:LuxR family maltose regulon positive regulatory protein